MRTRPTIIQGGMGVAVSDWRLAHTVSSLGQLGVVSGTGIDTVLVRRLQDGDPSGHIRRAMEAFPVRDIADAILRRFFVPGGRPPDAPYARLPLPTVTPSRLQLGAAMVGAFVEVWLAKAGHAGAVGINLLTKIHFGALPTLYGAMLAGVDVVLMGAGIPLEIPGALDRLARHQPASLRVDVVGATRDDAPVQTTFDPSEFELDRTEPLLRPDFLPIVASHALAGILRKRANGEVQGFVVEGPTAGGHNAPPRGPKVFDDTGQPVYGPRDEVDFDVMKEHGLPFWLAGGSGSPEGVRDALAAGADGVQVGTLFAFCEESGLDSDLKCRVLEGAAAGRVSVRTDPRASPTGFPFKVVELPGTAAEREVYEARERVCDLGYLREPYRTPDGKVGYRCASEPLSDYQSKGGRLEDTVGRKCLCNSLLADIGLAQRQKNGKVEPPLLTSGDDLALLGRFLDPEERARPYPAARVIDYLLSA